jgi:DNA-binding transcriptional regulator YdaS (Cro superfamily)
MKPNPIQDWLRANGRTSTWLASGAGCTESYLSQIGRGRRVPSKALAVAIEAVTGGGIAANTLVEE